MAKAAFHHHLFQHLRRYQPTSTTPFRIPQCNTTYPRRFLATTVTPCPLQYEMIISRPVNDPNLPRVRSPRSTPRPDPDTNSESDQDFNSWVDRKLSDNAAQDAEKPLVMDRAKRKYYEKRRKRMYGESESDDDVRGSKDGDFVELKQEVVELKTVHKKEEELYFYEAFSYPWEKNKHYKMVYQLEKKYFPDQCFDKAFLDAGEVSKAKNDDTKKKKGDEEESAGGADDKGLVFFEENVKVEDLKEKKVEDFFKCLKKLPNEKGGDIMDVEPFLSTRSRGLPPKWDGPNGTVVLVNKPKGEFFFIPASMLLLMCTVYILLFYCASILFWLNKRKNLVLTKLMMWQNENW